MLAVTNFNFDSSMGCVVIFRSICDVLRLFESNLDSFTAIFPILISSRIDFVVTNKVNQKTKMYYSVCLLWKSLKGKSSAAFPAVQAGLDMKEWRHLFLLAVMLTSAED